jgi:hypothetical protein
VHTKNRTQVARFSGNQSQAFERITDVHPSELESVRVPQDFIIEALWAPEELGGGVIAEPNSI